MITAKCDRQIGRDFVQKTFTISPWLLGGLNFILNFVIGYIGEVYPTLQVATGILTSILSPVLLIFGSIVYFRVYITNVDAAEMPLGNEA
ncbi:hypothetical protein [Vibrio lentus]|uniref:hypothetical protein n=1 Tax=Vibrio lentus TaxID=136468 RepID=UPI0038B2495E